MEIYSDLPKIETDPLVDAVRYPADRQQPKGVFAVLQPRHLRTKRGCRRVAIISLERDTQYEILIDITFLR